MIIPESMMKTLSILESPTQKSPTSLQEISLPTDVLIEILKRLPLKSLVSSTCVCKSWFNLLKSPIFLSILATYNLEKTDDTQRFVICREPIKIHVETHGFHIIVYENGIRSMEYSCPAGSNHFVVCSADGLLCLYKFYSRKPEFEPLILWNPSIQKALTVPVPRPVDYALECTVGGFPKLIFGVGFDSSSSDYKVARVSYFNGRGADSTSTNFRAHVYCLSDQKWRNLGLTSIPQCIITIRWRGVYLNGVIHWICNVFVNSNDAIQPSILILKLESEEFGEIKLPKEVLDVPYQKLKVVVVPRHGKKVLGIIHIVMNVFSLWVMEEYGVWESWVKLFSTNFKGMIKNDVNVVVVNDHFVMVQLDSNMWYSYDHNSQQIHKAELQPKFDYVDVYVENLILLGQQKGVVPMSYVEACGLRGPKKRLRNQSSVCTVSPRQSASC